MIHVVSTQAREGAVGPLFLKSKSAHPSKGCTLSHPRLFLGQTQGLARQQDPGEEKVSMLQLVKGEQLLQMESGEQLASDVMCVIQLDVTNMQDRLLSG